MEQTVAYLILIIGWPTLLILTFLIVRKARSFQQKLKGTLIGSLIAPTVFGWLYGMYALGLVSTAYIFDLPWYYTVVPAFTVFLIAVFLIYSAISKWEQEATELQQFYTDLEKLVEERTAELEESHKKQLAHEKEIQKLKDQFVFIAAHELKTPVTAINWAIELAMDQVGSDSHNEEIVKSLKSVEVSNKRLIKLVDDLLNVARIESGTIKVELGNFSVNDVTATTIEEMQSVFSKKSISVEYHPTEEFKSYADRGRFKQILINLLSNATKYNKENGRIVVSHEVQNESIVTHVRDEGMGIKEKDLKTLFTKFGRIKSEETQDIDGTGLGLYLCRQILDQMDGKIWVESTYGEGSTFSFSVPKQ